MSFAISSYSQNIIDNHFTHLVDHDESTVIHVSPRTFQYAAQILPENDEEEQTLKELISGIESFDLVAIEDYENARDEYDTGMAAIGGSYEELMNIKDGEDKFAVYVDETGDIVHEIVGIGIDGDEFIVFSLLGEMELSTIGEIINKMDSDEFEPLKKINSFSATQVKVYPNPISTDVDMSLEVPRDMIGGTVSIVDSGGSAIQQFEVTDTNHEIKTSGLKPGYYFIDIAKDGMNLKKKVLVIQ